MAVSRINEAGLNINQYGNRNLIINGEIKVAQRATGATTAANNYATVDRFKTWVGVTSGAYTSEQSTDVPSGQGFSNSLKLQCTTADTSTAAGEYAQFMQSIEAQNCQAFAYGTSGAKTLTLSFWCKSNKTGVYTVAFRKADSTVYMLPIEYTISSADTWEKKTITVSPTAGSTTFITNSAGAIANDNGSGLEVYWNLLLGSNYTGGTSGTWSSNGSHYSTTNAVNWLDNTANNFYITGVQLEVGDTATDFEHRTFGDELLRCQRYFYREVDDDGSMFSWVGFCDSSTTAYLQHPHPVEMRAEPSMSTTGTAGDYSLRIGGNTVGLSSVPALSSSTKKVGHVAWVVSSGLTSGQAAVGKHDAADKYIDWSAEL